MEISFDEKADALYIQFRNRKAKAKETIKLKEGILVDITKDGKLLGIEILDVTSRIPIKEIGHLNINLPIHSAK